MYNENFFIERKIITREGILKILCTSTDMKTLDITTPFERKIVERSHVQHFKLESNFTRADFRVTLSFARHIGDDL